MNIPLLFIGFIIAFVIVLYYERKIRRTEPKNKVHFYVARDKNGKIYLYLGKPIRCSSCFCTDNNVQLIAPGHNINKEIISKFEVNYVLKHEFHNDNKKSVVVDKELRTEDNLEKMSFDVIEGEQQRMF